MRYQWILFDADETLFHFDAFSGLRRMFEQQGYPFGDEDYQQFQDVNKPLWLDYQQGQITAAQLQERRFIPWASKLDKEPMALNRAFMQAMADICQPLPGATELVQSLRGKAQLGIITNGFTELQQIRLERTGFHQDFSVLVISEQVGVAKPDFGIFEHAFKLMGHPPKEQILMVGDNPHADILGGMNAGIATCWLNHHAEPVPAGIRPDYEVASLIELQQLLLPA